MDLVPPPDTVPAALGAVPVVPQAWVKHPPKGAAAAVPAPETLHPALWLGHQLGASAAQALASGFAALDAELPGGGWPRRALTELLLPQPGIGEIRLLAASLVAVQRGGRLVMLFDPPARVSAPALVALGLETESLLVVHSRAAAGADSLWAFEQALKSGHVGAAIAWLPPRLRTERLRRLQLAAAAHDGPAFVMRELAQAQRPSPAPLRLALRPAGADRLELHLLKRRGPPLAQPLPIVLPPVLPAAVRARAQRGPATLPAATFVNLV